MIQYVGEDGVVVQNHSKAIVTVLVGDSYIDVWRSLCLVNWEAYGKKHGYDVLVVTDLPDKSERGLSRSPAWQKLLVLSQPWSAGYERIVWLDADIIIAEHAPCIVAQVPDAAKVGVSRRQFSPDEFHIYSERLMGTPIDPMTFDPEVWTRKRYQGFGLPTENCYEVNTGVLVLSPVHHRELFEYVYDNYEDRGLDYEQSFLSYELQRRGLSHPFSARFNWQINPAVHLSHLHGSSASFEELIRFTQNELSKSYFLHFAGSMPFLQMIQDWNEKRGTAIGVWSA